MSNILLIEDEDSIRRVLKKVLQQDNQSYKFTEATDAVSYTHLTLPTIVRV